MKVILMNDIAKLGRKYDIKEVSSGHALNLLIPQGLAVEATREAVKHVEIQKAKLEGERKVHEELLAKNIDGLKDVVLTITGKANDKGHLFAGLHREALAKELADQAHIQIDPSFIRLEEPLKEVGEHIVEVKGGGDSPNHPGGKSSKFKVVIKSQK